VWLMKHLAGCRTLVDLNALPWDKILKVPWWMRCMCSGTCCKKMGFRVQVVWVVAEALHSAVLDNFWCYMLYSWCGAWHALLCRVAKWALEEIDRTCCALFAVCALLKDAAYNSLCVQDMVPKVHHLQRINEQACVDEQAGLKSEQNQPPLR
jgi:hypothetical protein